MLCNRLALALVDQPNKRAEALKARPHVSH